MMLHGRYRVEGPAKTASMLNPVGLLYFREKERSMTTDADLMNVHEVLARLTVSRTTLYSLLAKQQFPQPIRLGRCCRWPRSEVEGWLEAQAELRTEVREAAMR